MNAKENALKIINFDNPEYISGSVPGYWLGYCGVDHQGYQGGGHDCEVGTVWTDIWGTEWHKEYPGVMGFPKGNPLAEVEALETYVWPDPNDERISSWIYGNAKNITDQIRKENFIIGNHRDTLWEKSYMLVGMENMMIYLYTEPEFAKTVLHKIMDFQLGIAQHYVNCGVEMVFCSDDLGMQNSLLLPMDIINEFLVPEYKRLFDFYKKHNVIVRFHSCGHIEPLLETFIDLGIKILNPVQVTANNLENIIKVTKGRLALDGAISTALLEKGPVEQIRQTTLETLKLLDQNGGYFCGPDQYMPIPHEHSMAMWNALDEYNKTRNK